MQSSDPVLAELAMLYGVLPRYRDSRGVWRESSPRSIYQALAALGAQIDAGRAEQAVTLRKKALWDRMLEPVLVAWDGVPGPTLLRLPSGDPDAVELTLVLEDGAERSWRVPGESLRPAGQERVQGRDYTAWWLPRVPRSVLPESEGLAPGYHTLRVRAGRRQVEATLICAPRRCWSPPAEEPPGDRAWGVFTPLYALRSDRDWGAGDLADLAELADRVAEAGGRAVATLPLLAAFLGNPFEPGPYRPVSRLFWNEFYLAPEETAEWCGCAPARESWANVAERVAALRSADSVDYTGVMALKRSFLEKLSRYFFESGTDARREHFDRYLATHAEVADYAAFRSELETGQAGTTAGYHLYCQWQMDEQLRRFSTDSGATAGEAPGGAADAGRRAGLFLDVPVGVHPQGFDALRWRDAFVHSLSTGAPPDAFFALGQNWETPPPHPERMREQGHRYLVAYLREQMRHAAYLRIDHFMGLHRLYCMPEGCDAREGVYLTYPAEEQYAILSLESHRHRTVVVGEDLGTVPPEVRRSMRRHGVLGTWVLQLAAQPRSKQPVKAPPASVVAAVNTHDTFPFAGFVAGDDIAARVKTGQVGSEAARREAAARHTLVAKLETWLPEVTRCGGAPGAEGGLFARTLSYLAGTRAAFVLVSLEDLWAEARPQNQPGTGAEHGNWQRKVAVSGRQVKRAVERASRIISAGRSAARDSR
jgi:4-alpha-glucanotransferase